MSTPENQRMSEPLENAANALEKLADPIRARLKNPDYWKDDHLKEIGALLVDLAAMEIRLRDLLARNQLI